MTWRQRSQAVCAGGRWEWCHVHGVRGWQAERRGRSLARSSTSMDQHVCCSPALTAGAAAAAVGDEHDDERERPTRSDAQVRLHDSHTPMYTQTGFRQTSTHSRRFPAAAAAGSRTPAPRHRIGKRMRTMLCVDPHCRSIPVRGSDHSVSALSTRRKRRIYS